MDSKIKAYSSRNIFFLDKFREYKLQFSGHFNRVFQNKSNIEKIFSDIKLYENILNKYTDKKIDSSRVFEIGYGARPNRLLAMMGMNIDAFGVDLEKPVLKLTPADCIDIIKFNGFERFFKSFFRYIIFDRSERTQISKYLKENWVFT